jgi:L-fucose isomerase-like protein
MCHIINASFRMWDVRTGRAIRTMTGHLVSNHHGKMFTIMISELTPVSYRNVPVSMRSLKMGFKFTYFRLIQNKKYQNKKFVASQLLSVLRKY